MKTVFKPNPNWWGKPEHNLTEVTFQTIKSDATRVAALLSGEIDMMDPVPVQDIDRLKANPNASVLIGPEIRTIFLNMDPCATSCCYSSVKGKNPFKDARVRKAFYQAIDIEAIHTKVMRGMSVNSALMISPLLYSRAAEFKRHPYDVAAAKKLLAEAGYPNGFEVVLDCPNDRYVNDEGICQAVAQMLSRIDIKVKLNAMPKAKYFQKAGPTEQVRLPRFNLLGWTPGSLRQLERARRTSSAAAMPTARAAPSTSAATAIPKITELQRPDPRGARHQEARRADRPGLPHQPRGGRSSRCTSSP